MPVHWTGVVRLCKTGATVVVFELQWYRSPAVGDHVIAVECTSTRIRILGRLRAEMAGVWRVWLSSEIAEVQRQRR